MLRIARDHLLPLFARVAASVRSDDREANVFMLWYWLGTVGTVILLACLDREGEAYDGLLIMFWPLGLI